MSQRVPTLSELLRRFDPPPELRDTLARAVYNLGGGRVPFAFTNTVLGPLVNNVGLVIMTTPPLNPGVDGGVILVVSSFSVGPIGATGTLFNYNINKGVGLGTPSVGPQAFRTTAAGNLEAATIIGIDTPGAVAGQQYTTVCNVTGASANTPVNLGQMIALALG